MYENFQDKIFRADFDLRGSHLIAASAGTGKTYQIQNIYARLLLECDLRVSEILVMTFTNAATQELKLRICAVLKTLKKRLVPSPGDPQGKEEKRADLLLHCAEEKRIDRRQLAFRVERALLEFDRAAISTIHGFCERTLARYAFESGFRFDLPLDDESGTRTLRRMCRDWWMGASGNQKDGFSWNELFHTVKLLRGRSGFVLGDAGHALLNAAQEIVKNYEKNRSNRDAMTYDDLLRALQEALTGGRGAALAEKLRRDFKAALIDEFQDTDPVQYEIFRRIFQAEGDTPLFFIGDPKQAIYSFRGGDIFTYRSAVAALPDDRIFKLTENHRTTSRLMDAVNGLFRDGETPGKTFEDETIPYEGDVTAAGDHQPLKENGVPDDAPFKFLQLAIPDHENPDKLRTDNETLFEATAGEISRTLHMCRIVEKDAQTGDFRERDLKPHDIAVLVEINRDGASIAKWLKQWAIPCVIEKNGSVFASDTVSAKSGEDASSPSSVFWDLYALIRAVAFPHDRRAVRRAAASGFFGMKEDFFRLTDDASLAAWVTFFQELGRGWERSGLSAFWGKVDAFSRNCSGSSLRENLARGLHGKRDLADFEEILGRIFAAFPGKSSPEKLLTWLDRRYEKLGEEAELFMRSSRDDGDAVRIMTIHAAKGLQFPVVFLPLRNDGSRKGNRAPVYGFHAGNDQQLTFCIHSEEGNARYDAENRQEQIRKIYVAMTRAQQRTVVLYTPPKGNSSAEKSTMKALVLSGKLFGKVKQDEMNLPVSCGKMKEIPSFCGYAAPVDFSVETETPWHGGKRMPLRGSYSSLQPVGDADTEGRDREYDDLCRFGNDPAEKISPVFRLEGGAVLGNCWHEILENLAFDADGEEIRATAKRSLVAYGFAGGEKGERNLEIVCDMLRKTLDYPLFSPDGKRFTLRQIPWRDRLSEQEFAFSSAKAVPDVFNLVQIVARHWQNLPEKKIFLDAMANWQREIPHGFLIGFIDLFFRYDDFYYVVDWKSNTLKEERLRRLYSAEKHDDGLAFDETGVAREMARHWYFFQYLLYSAVVHRYLKQFLKGKYCWEKHFGGIRYFFLRGIAAGGGAPVFADRPGEALLDELGDALGME